MSGAYCWGSPGDGRSTQLGASSAETSPSQAPAPLGTSLTLRTLLALFVNVTSSRPDTKSRLKVTRSSSVKPEPILHTGCQRPSDARAARRNAPKPPARLPSPAYAPMGARSSESARPST
eukprot:scaffold24408_cov30-Tisochrysis_lutea.AAC.1